MTEKKEDPRYDVTNDTVVKLMEGLAQTKAAKDMGFSKEVLAKAGQIESSVMEIRLPHMVWKILRKYQQDMGTKDGMENCSPELVSTAILSYIFRRDVVSDLVIVGLTMVQKEADNGGE